MSARPFIKSAGGKTSLLPTLLEYVPEKFDTYYEPFVGGGALFFELANQERFRRAHLNDTNPELANAYQVVRDEPESLIRKLRWYQKQHALRRDAFYYEVRARTLEIRVQWTPLNKAAWFIYLNKTCFNGLWRVNKSGNFNVPFGDYKDPKICDKENLVNCSFVLRRTKAIITENDFQKHEFRPTKDDVVFFDPPYLPRLSHEFVGYTKDKFGLEDHVRLRDTARELKERGVFVMITNSGADEIRKLYSKGFKIIETPGRRSVGATAERRGYVPDVLIM